MVVERFGRDKKMREEIDWIDPDEYASRINDKKRKKQRKMGLRMKEEMLRDQEDD